MTYSYEDFEKAANKAGVLGQFGQADLSTAKKNPDFGMSILNQQNCLTFTRKSKKNKKV